MKDNLVVQSNKLVEAHYRHRYSVQEQRMVLWIISEVHKGNYKESYFRSIKTGSVKTTISAQKYAEMMGINVTDVYKRAQQIGNSLMQKVIKIDTGAGWVMFNWLCQMEYREGRLEATITEKILPYIIDLKEKFTAFKLENVLYIRSSHAIKLYQILAQYKQIGEREIKIW